jgi:hypothetical protein
MVVCPAVDARPSWLLVLLTVVFIFNQAHRQLLAVLIPAGECGVPVHVNRVTVCKWTKWCSSLLRHAVGISRIPEFTTAPTVQKLVAYLDMICRDSVRQCNNVGGSGQPHSAWTNNLTRDHFSSQLNMVDIGRAGLRTHAFRFATLPHASSCAWNICLLRCQPQPTLRSFVLLRFSLLEPLSPATHTISPGYLC